MPRLLILCEYPTLLGGERSMLATVAAVAEASFEVHVAAPPHGPLAEELKRLDVPHLPWPTHGTDGVRLPLERLRADLDVLLTTARPDLVHANSLSTSRISGPVVATRRLVSVGHLRDIVKLAPQAVADINAHRRLIAVSQATCDFHVRQGIDADKCAVLHNGVDLTVFRPRPATGFLHAELELPTETRLAVSVGQLGMRKGTDVALSAFAQVATEFSDWHYLLVGEQTSKKLEADEFVVRLHAIARKLLGRVHFLGTREDVPAILDESELLIHAARQEPLGRVLLEAAASGVAVVATDVGGTREIFPNKDAGAILVPADDPSTLSQSLTAILSDDARRKAMAYAARRRAEQAFDVHCAAARLIDQYQRVLAPAR